MDEWEAFRADALKQVASAAKVDEWLAGTRICLQLENGGEGTPVGQIGGWPTLPGDVPWPVDADGDELGFLAAVNCAALPRPGYLGISLPAQGHLLFFQAFEPWERGGPQLSQQVLHVPTLGPEQAHLPHYERVDLHHPSVRFSRHDSHLGPYAEDPDGLTELARTHVPEVDQPGLERDADMAGCVRIGGHAYVAHNSPEMSVMYELAAQGLLPTPLPAPGYSPEFNGLHQQMEREWVPLVQFGLLDEDYPMTIARFMIRRTDLAQERFDRTICDGEFGG